MRPPDPRAALTLLAAPILRCLPGSEIAFFHDFRPPPYGGSNQFMRALRTELERQGRDVGPNRVGRRTRAAVLNSFVFDERRLASTLHAGCRVVHRVDGPIALYRGHDDGTDARVAALNERHADVTVFQSRWSLDAHRELGVELRRPVVVRNAVDPAIFHPPAQRREPSERVRVISTSWSDNPNKGSAAIAAVEQQLDWSRLEYTFAGRSPIRFERVRMLPPLDSHALADVLREHDVYVAASRNDPASNAVLEALACGLPVVYARSGGHPELVGDAGIGFDDDDELPAALERAADELESLRARIAIPSIADVAAGYLKAMGL